MTKILLLSERRRILDLLDELEDKHKDKTFDENEFTEIIDEIREELD